MTDSEGRRLPMWDQMSAPTQPGLPDAGPQLLTQFRSELAMDKEWTVQDERGLLWWGAPLPLIITVDHPRLCEGDPTIKITASVAVIDNASVDTGTIATTLADFNRRASVGTLVWDPIHLQVYMFVTHYSYDDNSRLTEIFSPFALLAYTEALSNAFDLARELGGELATRPHPTTGYREDFDELLSTTASVIVPRGEATDSWVPEEFHSVEVALRSMNLDTNRDGLTVTAEFPIQPYTLSDQRETSLLQILLQHHPVYGYGILSVLHMPTLHHPARAAELATSLNAAEYLRSTGTSAFGAWSTGAEGSSVTHVTFLPNAFARPGLLTTIAYQAATRNLWASSWFAEQRQDLSASDSREPAEEAEDSESAKDWEIRMMSYLANVTPEDLPSMEILFLNALGSWIYSSANPGENYEQEHGGEVITALLEAAGQSSSLRPDQQPVSTPEISAVRAAIANGAREIATAEGGLGILISRLMPAAIGELNRLTGDPGAQSYWLYVYGMFVLAGGREGTQGDESMRAIADTFAGWNTLMAAGFNAPQGLSLKMD